MMAAIGLAFVAIGLFGCSDLNSLDNGLSVFTDEERCIVEISVTNLLSSSRQVFPDRWDIEEIKNLDIFISGTSALGENLAEKELTQIKTDGTEKVELSYSYWDLTLTAKDGTDVVLQANSTVDLTNGVKTVPFTLSSKNISTPGSILIEGTYEADPDSVNKITMGLYNYATGELAVPSETVYEDATIPANNEFSYSVASVAPGTYLFNINFYKQVGTDYKKIGNYGDLVTVIPGKPSKDTDVEITTINKKPASPENLVVYYEDDFMDVGAGYYTVTLEWEDKSYNEDNFVITVYKCDAWDAEPQVYKTLGVGQHSFANDSMRESGSVLAGNTSVQIQLQYGEIYDFGIQAQNCIGLSSVTPVMRVSGPDDLYYNDERIARTLISYDLNGGTLVPAGETDPFAGTTWLEACDYTGTNITLTTDLGTLTKGEFAFQKWVDGTADDATEVTETDGANNITVFAKYNDTPYVNVDWDHIDIEAFVDANELVQTRLSVQYNGAAVASDTIISKSNSNNSKTLTFDITDAEEGQPAYKGIKIFVGTQCIASSNNNTVNIPYGKYKDFTGETLFTICTKCIDNNELYSAQVTLTFGR